MPAPLVNLVAVTKPSHVFLNLPEFSLMEDLGFGVPVSHACQVPSYLSDWVTEKEGGVSFNVNRNPLLDEASRSQMAAIATEHDDFLALLGTKNNISRILLACASPTIDMIASAERDWIRIRIPTEEWFHLVAPKLLALEAALRSSDVDAGVPAACMVAASRYLGLHQDML